MPVYKDASDLTRRKNAMTIYTNIKKQKEALEKGLIKRVLYQGGGDSTGTFILTQMKKGSVYSSDLEMKESIKLKAHARQLEAHAQSVEAKRLEAYAQELEAYAQELQAHAQSVEVERLEVERLEAERLENQRLENERLENERLENERLENQRLENERLENERLEVERLENQRLEAERLEAERLEAERLEAERLEAERLEAERLEAERLEAERLENQRLEAERLEAPVQSVELPKQIKVLILGDVTIGLTAIKIKTALQAEYTKVKADVCILGTTYDGSHLYEYDRVYYYPTPAHPGAPSLQQNIDNYIKNGGMLLIK